MGFNITQILFSKSENVPTEKQSPEMGLKRQKVPPPPQKKQESPQVKTPQKSTRKFGNCSIHSSLHHFCVVWCLDIGRSTGGTWCFYGDVQFPKSGGALEVEVEGDGSHQAIDL